MKKIMLSIGITIIFFASFVMVKRSKQPTKTAAYAVGIVQTASHPALDAVREGFIEVLQRKMGDSIEFVIQNAQGSVAQAHAIAQQFHSNKQYNGFFAIATPAAQAMSAVQKEKPLIIAAVTDPDALGLMHPTTNVCGVNDMIDVRSEIEMLTQLLPNVKKVGLLYTAGEANSIAVIKQMHQELETRDLAFIDFAIGSEADISAMVHLACRKTDVILAPTDNMVACAIAIIATIAGHYKKPLIVSDNMLVKFGALAARGVDYKAHGKQAGEVAYKILVEGKKPCELPIEPTKSEQIVVNQATLAALGLTIPHELQPYVVLV